MEEIKKEPVTVLLILINTLIFLVVEFTGGSENGQHRIPAYAAMRCCLCTADPGTGTVVSDV